MCSTTRRRGDGGRREDALRSRRAWGTTRLMSGPTIDTYECVHCKKEVPWYQPGDPDTRRADYELKTCATCRQIAKNKAAAMARRVARLPRPATPCTCGCADFLCSPFNEHTGEYRSVEGLMFSAVATRPGGALYLVACRACGRAEIYVEGIQTLEPDPNLDIHAVGVRAPAPYR